VLRAVNVLALTVKVPIAPVAPIVSVVKDAFPEDIVKALTCVPGEGVACFFPSII
jgi:hypothetical protein